MYLNTTPKILSIFISLLILSVSSLAVAENTVPHIKADISPLSISIPPPPKSKPDASASELNPVGDYDRHYVPLEAYFIGKDSLSSDHWIYVSLALKEQSVFLKDSTSENFVLLNDGKHVWTKYFWKSRPAAESDLKIGTIVIFLEKGGDLYYVQPNNYETSLDYLWIMATIIDVNDIAKGYVTVSGPSKVGLGNLRVVIQ
ncbi:MAG: hypothetical protein HXX17_07125 [Geobacteraceae bacterium]|nr:hypothetical protein [Geobacteraceae bacterium]